MNEVRDFIHRNVATDEELHREEKHGEPGYELKKAKDDAMKKIRDEEEEQEESRGPVEAIRKTIYEKTKSEDQKKKERDLAEKSKDAKEDIEQWAQEAKEDVQNKTEEMTDQVEQKVGEARDTLDEKLKGDSEDEDKNENKKNEKD